MSMLERRSPSSIIIPHGIAMPKGLYFTAVVFSSFFLLSFLTPKCLIADVTERISTKHMTAISKKLSKLPRAFTPTGWGQRTLIWTDFEVRPNISLQQNMILTIGTKIINLQGLLYMPPNLVNFSPDTAKNGCRVFAHP